jgi:pantetheine-phosphate adenylyltransferase
MNKPGDQWISERLKKIGFSDSVLASYDEPWRFYHTREHLREVLDFLRSRKAFSDELFLAAVYHDSVYSPKSKDNEARSAERFQSDASEAGLGKKKIKAIVQLILDTKDHEASSPESQKLIDADLQILTRPLSELIVHERKIYKEYQFMPDAQYRKERVRVLSGLNKNGRLDELIEFVRNRKPFIGLFCGSFNPFHRGHYNVLQKAERIFDKVIVAFGKNPEKHTRKWKMPKTIRFRQIGEYSGLLTDYVASLGHDVVVVRGLRNSTDFQYEQNQYRYLQELMPGIKIINIFCDKEFEHISSSGIRTLEPFGKHVHYLLE